MEESRRNISFEDIQNIIKNFCLLDYTTTRKYLLNIYEYTEKEINLAEMVRKNYE